MDGREYLRAGRLTGVPGRKFDGQSGVVSPSIRVPAHFMP